MKANEYLQQINKLDKMIQNKLIEIEQWKAIAGGVTGQAEGERVQSSGTQQKMADAVCKYVMIEEEINADIDRLVYIKQDVIKTIEMLPTVEYDVLHKIYIQGMEFDEVAGMQNKSRSWVKKNHGKGLAHVQAIIDERGDGICHMLSLQSNGTEYAKG